MRRSLGDKRRQIPPERAQDIVQILASRIDEEKGFQALGQSEKRGDAGAKEQADGRALQDAIRTVLRTLPDIVFKERNEFERTLDSAARKASLKLPAPVRKAMLSALSEHDETAAICRDKEGNPEPDPELRDTESVPLPEGDDPADGGGLPASVGAFFDREVRPHVPDAWIDTSKRDPKDGRVGLIGYEINFNRYFYRYTPPRPLEEIEADIRAIEGDIVRMLAEVTGANTG
jgi:type I restriction enzyme M protein